MILYNGFEIINPYQDHDYFKKWPKGENMQLTLMCSAPEGSLFFFPEKYDITTHLEDRIGHPMAVYSPGFSSLDEIKKAIDEWIPTYKLYKEMREDFISTGN